ncbi:rCG56491 [Rattus norvegicus]|uniref:RCG56491 n=1 Tax=Rattus norvegicus TaxID=10116 RepID=A6IBQ1_RAT|nr:rCG56491 [Rattus norvegicus]
MAAIQLPVGKACKGILQPASHLQG